MQLQDKNDVSSPLVKYTFLSFLHVKICKVDEVLQEGDATVTHIALFV